VNFDPTLKRSDQSTLDEYEEELRLYEEELVNQRRLKAVELFMREKEARLERIKEEIGWLGFGGGELLPRLPSPSRTALTDFPSVPAQIVTLYRIGRRICHLLSLHSPIRSGLSSQLLRPLPRQERLLRTATNTELALRLTKPRKIWESGITAERVSSTGSQVDRAR
jgi:hypothetical protein